MTNLTVSQQQIQAVLVDTIGAEPTTWEAIQTAVKAEMKIRNWSSVRNVLQFLMDKGFISRTDDVNAEQYQLTPAECGEATDHVEAKPQGKKPLDILQLKAICKELKIPTSKTTPRADLVHAIAQASGWADETPEVIEFLISGGQIETLPGFTGIAPKPNNRETSAGGKVQPHPEKPAKQPRKVGKGDKKPATGKAPTGDTVTIQEICEELGVEGRIARRKLRGSDIAKPADSWTWEAGHADIAKVRTLLSK